MNLRGNTIFITGGGSGIGRGLAEDLYSRGNTVIVAGRRRSALHAVAAANPGIQAMELDVTNPRSIERVASELVRRFPSLNVLINNAGVMIADQCSGEQDDDVLLRHVQTNFLGPVRLTSALIGHLKQQRRATIVYTSSTLAFSPSPMFSVYSATKAALHSYITSQRMMLRGTSVSVQELTPNFVATDLLGAPDPRAGPLDAYVEAAVLALATGAHEVRLDEPGALTADDSRRTSPCRCGEFASPQVGGSQCDRTSPN